MPVASKTPLTEEFVAILERRGVNLAADQEADDIVARMKVLELGSGAVELVFDIPVDGVAQPELKLGPFNQGVCFECDEEVLNDVASRTPIAAYSNGSWAVLDVDTNVVPLYRRLFIQ